MNIGIVGLPNVGKSTLFKALTKKQIDIANYPFCTIEPNTGIVKVPDERLEKLAVFSHSEKILPAAMEFVDIAGLVAGASKGEGLGNAFLAHIRLVDAIAHVVRTFEGTDVIHVSGKTDPLADAEVINIELALSDLAVLQKRLDTLRGKMKSGSDTESVARLALYQDVEKLLERGVMLYTQEWTPEQRELLRELNLITLKPMIYVLNTDETGIVSPEIVEAFKHKSKDQAVITLCAKQEADMAELTDEELEELGMKRTGLDRLIVQGYATLGLITYFTTGPKEARAWTINKGMTAPQAAGKIHTDFEKGFIRAEVISWKDLLDAGSEVAAKEKGLIRLEGKTYIAQDGDVMVFHFN